MLLLGKEGEAENARFLGSFQKSIDLAHEAKKNSSVQPSSFLSIQEMGEEVIGMEPTVEYVLHWVMKPVLATILKMLDTDQEAALNEDLAHGVNEQVPGDTSAMMTETVTENVTGPVTDAVVDEVQKFISATLPNHISSYVGKHVPQAIVPRIHTPVSNIMVEVMPQRLSRGAPTLVARSLYITLTQALTRSITHVVVPSISKSATHNRAQSILCKWCFETGKYCTRCQDSPQSSYYHSYYSTYYSDWYADYYANYYTDALENIDTVHHPLGHRSNPATPIGTLAQGWNEGMMKKLKKAEIEALGAANKGPVVPQIANMAAGLDEKKPSEAMVATRDGRCRCRCQIVCRGVAGGRWTSRRSSSSRYEGRSYEQVERNVARASEGGAWLSSGFPWQRLGGAASPTAGDRQYGPIELVVGENVKYPTYTPWYLLYWGSCNTPFFISFFYRTHCPSMQPLPSAHQQF